MKAPRMRDRTGTIRFTSSILPPDLRRTQTIETLLPWLYLKGISTGDFGEALTDGFRESAKSWKDVLLDLKRRGLTVDPRLAIGDGALGFWNALPQVFGQTRTQRCWVYKTGNVLNKLPKHLQANAKRALHQIGMASTREHASQTFETFFTAYTPQYPKAAECLVKDKQALLAFYDFPAQHWHHIRTTNRIESTFATVRLRTAKTRGCVSRTNILGMVFTLGKSTESRWLKLRGTEQRTKLIYGVRFKNGVAVQKESRQEIAA